MTKIGEILRLQYSSKMVLVSSPESASQGVNCRLGAQGDVPEGNKKAGRYGLARQVLLPLYAARSGGGQKTQSSCPGNRLRPAVDIEFAIDIARVDLDRIQREIKPGRDFWIGQPLRDELQYF